jgi:hypothetical protein
MYGMSPTDARKAGIPFPVYPKLSFPIISEERKGLTMNKKFSKEERETCIPIIKQIMDLALLTRNEGVLALEVMAQKPETEPLISVAIRLLVDGTDPVQVRLILEKIIESEQYEGSEYLKALIIIEGLLGIQAGEHPNLIQRKLSAFLGLDAVVNSMKEDDIHAKETMEDTLEHYKNITNPAESETFITLINKLSDREVQMLLKEVDMYSLADALKICDYKTMKKFMDNLSFRIGVLTINIMHSRAADNEKSFAAQKEIMEIFKEIYPHHWA